MKLFKSFLSVLLLLLLTICLSSCAEFAGAVVGGVAGGVYAGLTGDEEGGYQIANQVAQGVVESAAREAARQHEQELMAKLPPGVACPSGKLYQDDNNCYIYSLNDQNQTWYKWTGVAWINPDADIEVASTPSNAPTAPRAVPRAQPAPAPQMRRASIAEAPGEDKPVSISEARQIKRDQGLDGRLYPDKTKKTWYLEDQEGTTYKLKNGAFVKI